MKSSRLLRSGEDHVGSCAGTFIMQLGVPPAPEKTRRRAGFISSYYGSQMQYSAPPRPKHRECGNLVQCDDVVMFFVMTSGIWYSEEMARIFVGRGKVCRRNPRIKRKGLGLQKMLLLCVVETVG